MIFVNRDEEKNHSGMGLMPSTIFLRLSGLLRRLRLPVEDATTVVLAGAGRSCCCCDDCGFFSPLLERRVELLVVC